MPNEVIPPTTPAEQSIAAQVMEKIHTNQTSMKPRWYFVAGSLALFSGIVGLLSLSVFFMSFVFFFLRTHGPRAGERFQSMLEAFPWSILILAVFAIGLGIWLLRRYDFSYRKNFLPLMVALTLAIVGGGFLMDYLGFDRPLIERGPMRGFYERYDGSWRNGRHLPPDNRPWRSNERSPRFWQE